MEINNNNNNNNDSDNINYKYYKLIFGNIFIKNKIYGFIRQSYQYLFGNRFKDISLFYIDRSKDYQLLIDRQTVGLKFKEIRVDSIYPFLVNLRNHYYKNSDPIEIKQYNSILTTLYQTNKDEITIYHNDKYTDFGNFNNNNVFDLIQVLISSNCLVILKLLYQDHLNGYQFTGGKFDFNGYGIGHHRYIKCALQCKDLEILKFIHCNWNIKYETNEKFINGAIYWALDSSNRNEIITYLLDEMNYKLPKNIKHTPSKINSYQGKFIKLHFKLLKRLINLGFPIIYNQHLLSKELIYALNEWHQLQQNNSTTLSNELNLIKCTIFIVWMYTKNNQLQRLLQSIKQLNKIDQQQENEIIKLELINNFQFNSNDGITNIKNKLFNSLPWTIQIPTFNQPTVPLFEQFNFEREIKRIYIFDFLLKNNLIDNITMSRMVIEFASKYKEYSLITDYSLYRFNDMIENCSTIIDTCQIVATKNADSFLLKYIFSNFTSPITNTVDFGQVYKSPATYKAQTNKDCESLNIFHWDNIAVDQQIEYFINLVTNNVNYPVSLKYVLNHIFTINNGEYNNNNNNNNNNLSIENLNEITKQIQYHYQFQIDNKIQYPKKFEANILIYNNNASEYYQSTNELKQLFHNWDDYFTKIKILNKTKSIY